MGVPIHVYPVGDAGQHVLHCDYPQASEDEPGMPRCLCPCQPTWKEEHGTIIFVHNSFDGREGLEWLNDVLDSKPAFEV